MKKVTKKVGKTKKVVPTQAVSTQGSPTGAPVMKCGGKIKKK
jgi:hypothetical protein